MSPSTAKKFRTTDCDLLRGGILQNLGLRAGLTFKLGSKYGKRSLNGLIAEDQRKVSIAGGDVSAMHIGSSIQHILVCRSILGFGLWILRRHLTFAIGLAN